MSELGNKLLFAVSALGSCGATTFQRVFDGLYGQERRGVSAAIPLFRVRRRAVEALSELGHAEFDSTEDLIHVGRPTLVRLPFSGVAEYVVCGERRPQTLRLLRAALRGYRERAQISVLSQSDSVSVAPDCIKLAFDSERTASSFASDVDMSIHNVPAAWDLLDFAPTIEDFEATLRWHDGPELLWARVDFDVKTFRFRSGVELSDSLFRLSRYNDGSQFRYKNYVWRGGMYSEADPTWAKHLLFRYEDSAPLRYLPEPGAVCVPVGLRLPSLYSRALVLCSGFAPRLAQLPGTDSIRYLIYDRVPADVYERLHVKLGYGPLSSMRRTAGAS